MRAGLVLLVLVGCRQAPPVVAPSSVGLPVERHCTDVDGALLGRLPLTVEVGPHAVTFAEWTVPDERSTRVVGFATHLPGDVSFTVKAGADEFQSTSPRWLHPRGVSGPRVHPVERITFCANSRPEVVARR